MTEPPARDSESAPIWLLVLRWMLVLPASLVISFIAYAVIRLPNAILVNRWRGSVIDIVTQVLGDIAMGILFVWTAYAVAPSHRKQVSVVLTGFGLLICGAVYTISALYAAQNDLGVLFTLRRSGLAIGLVLGASIVLSSRFPSAPRQVIARMVSVLCAIGSITLFVLGFLAYFITSSPDIDGTMQDGLGRALERSPFFMRMILGQERLWAGWFWWVADMAIFGGGLWFLYIMFTRVDDWVTRPKPEGGDR